MITTDPCRSDGTYFQGSCYKKLPAPMPFKEATAKCSAQGASLPVITTDVESTFIQEHIQRPTWINLTPESGSWRWADGTPTNVTKWYPGQPQRKKDCNCAVVDNRGIKTGWKVEHCSAYRNIICEKGICLM